MPCNCDGYPEPTLVEQLASREREAKRRFDELYECHQRVVAERDSLLEENEKLKAALIKRAIG